ncbi:FERM domain-containing protein 6-like isoform X1 [Xyrichtys novacula]|uniref:FERM domain-containing protein 6-like isoform X1 n=1 Tax=Xyrichtys novacula TaxID=13765 RepID=A0AAV1H4B1_XYRNO|nr:FERM domain-containing protein 6-like isoform X1 [Xyrichtys novacula]
MRRRQKRQVCILLPNKQHLDCTVGVGSRGCEVLKCVLKQLSVSELQVFGLAVLRDNEYLFIDLEQKLSKYFGKTWSRGSSMVQFILFLKVQFYVENGLLLFSSKVLQLYYAELRQKVLQSQSHHQEALFFQLAASALQAEVGDLEQRDASDEEEGEENRQQGRHYFLPEDYFPSWLIKRHGRDFLLQHGPVLHSELRGLPHRQAILRFIKEAKDLQDGVATFYRMRQEKKELRSSVLLGVALRGIQLYQEVEGKRCLLYDLSWTDIDLLTFQGCRFEISAVGSLCLPKLLYYTPSTFHSKHILKHLSDRHRFHIHTRDALSYIQQLEDKQACELYKEAYICDITRLTQQLKCNNSLTSSMSDCSFAVTTAWSNEDEEQEEEEVCYSEFEMCVDDPEELLVDDPAEVSWLAELLSGVSVDAPLLFPSPRWAVVTMEMKQVLRRRADEGVSVD